MDVKVCARLKYAFDAKANRLILLIRANMQLGVKTGMVRSKFNCKSGIDAFKQSFKKISSENNPREVLSEWFVKYYIEAEFTKNLTDAHRSEWKKKYEKSFEQSVNDSLVEGRYW